MIFIKLHFCLQISVYVMQKNQLCNMVSMQQILNNIFVLLWNVTNIPSEQSELCKSLHICLLILWDPSLHVIFWCWHPLSCCPWYPTHFYSFFKINFFTITNNGPRGGRIVPLTFFLGSYYLFVNGRGATNLT